MLSVVAQDHEYPYPCPSVEEGAQLVSSAYPGSSGSYEEVKFQAIPVKDQATNTENNSMWDGVKAAYAKSVDFGNKTVNSIEQKITKFSQRPQIKKMEEKSLELAGKFEERMNSFINRVTSKPAVQNPIVKVKYGYSNINADPAVQKLKVDTMMLLQDPTIAIKREPKSVEDQNLEN